MRKRNVHIIVALLIVVLLLAAGYLGIPRSVVPDPKNTTILYISAGPTIAYYESEENPSFEWYPETEDEQEIAQQIVAYLAGCRERRTLWRGSLDGTNIPGSQRVLIVRMEDPYGERGIMLVSDQAWLPGGGAKKNSNVSYEEFNRKEFSRVAYGEPGPGNALSSYLHGFKGKLLAPEEMRVYILEALGLPADYT